MSITNFQELYNDILNQIRKEKGFVQLAKETNGENDRGYIQHKAKLDTLNNIAFKLINECGCTAEEN